MRQHVPEQYFRFSCIGEREMDNLISFPLTLLQNFPYNLADTYFVPLSNLIWCDIFSKIFITNLRENSETIIRLAFFSPIESPSQLSEFKVIDSNPERYKWCHLSEFARVLKTSVLLICYTSTKIFALVIDWKSEGPSNQKFFQPKINLSRGNDFQVGKVNICSRIKKNWKIGKSILYFAADNILSE